MKDIVMNATVTLRDSRSVEIRFNSAQPIAPRTAIMAANMAFGPACVAQVWLDGDIWQVGGFGRNRRARRVI
jgi:hypothetical protein